MNSKSENRRNWIKNIAIIFLVVLLLLTFFSNTIMNYSLPEVSAQYAQYGTVSSALKLTGTVAANENYNVYYEQASSTDETTLAQTRKVISVYVKAGDTVAIGDPIISLTGGASTELESAITELAALKKEYELAQYDDKISDLNEDKDITEKKQSIEDKNKELEKLQTLYNNLLSGTDTTAVIKEQIKAAEDEKKKYENAKADIDEKISELKSEISTAKAGIETDYSGLSLDERFAAAESEYNTLKAQFDELTTQLTNAKLTLDNNTEGNDDVAKAYEISQTIKTLKSQYDELTKTRGRYVEDYYDNYDVTKSILESYKAVLDAAQAALDNYTKTGYINTSSYESAVKKAGETLDSAYSTLMTKIAKDGTIIDDVVLVIKNAYTYYKTTGNEADATSFSSLLATYAEADYSDEVANVNKALEVYETALSYRKNVAVNDLEYYVRQAQAAYDAAKAEADSYSSDKEDASAYKTFVRQVSDYDDQLADLNQQISDAYEKLDILGMPYIDDVTQYQSTTDLAEAQKNYDKIKAEYDECSTKYTAAKEKYESLLKQKQYQNTINTDTPLVEQYQAQSDEYQEKIDEVTDKISDLNEDLTEAKSGSSQKPEDVLEQIETKKREISTAETELEILVATQNKTNAETSNTREEQEKKIADLEAKIEEYENAPETTQVTAPIAGRIASINFVPGNSVTSGDLVAQIEISDKGYKCEITVSADEARKINTSSAVTVSNSWWYSEISASITQIKADSASQGKKRIIVLSVTGDVYDGQSLTFSIGDKSQSYDTVLPNSAIREDSEGKFVLVVESKNTPLSTRYTARRYAIEILASDDTQTAVSGLYGSEFVITNSTSPISDGQQVRLADS